MKPGEADVLLERERERAKPETLRIFFSVQGGTEVNWIFFVVYDVIFEEVKVF